MWSVNAVVLVGFFSVQSLLNRVEKPDLFQEEFQHYFNFLLI